MKKVKIVIAQLGSPKTPSTSHVRTYLKKFLGDKRVIDLNPFLWKIILYLFVLPFRPKNSAKAYSRIWDGEKFPLVDITHRFVRKLQSYFDPKEVEFDAAFLLSSPRPKDVFEKWSNEDPTRRAQSVLVLPQFPQYSESTIASVFDNLAKDVEDLVNFPDIHFISSFHRSKAFIDNYARLINEKIEKDTDDLVISFHGIPLRRVIQKKDVYYRHCYETFSLLKDRVKGIDHQKIHMVFQSRFGSEQWLGPSADEYCSDLAKEGSKKIVVVCPSFTVDCLETTDEISHELAIDVKEHGGEIIQVPCLNDDDQWVKDYADYVKGQIHGNLEEKEQLEYTVDDQKISETIPEQKQVSPPLTDDMKKVLKVVFLAVFLDLVGFSIIFPLFPALAKYYLEVDGQNYFLKLIWNSVEWITAQGGGASFRPVVLFGGILGALYSLLQFISAPLWGSLSDKIGRKPVMLVTVTGLCLSYVLWIFAGSFSLLIVARFLGGLMGGNLSTATAIVSDITDHKRRSKGMAFIGIAFAFGFIFGPAIGGILSLVDLSQIYPSLKAWGVNPFSVPALFAGILGLINIFMIRKSLPETLSKKSERVKRTANVVSLLKPMPYKGINQTNIAYFLFITAFSGMEFTLTFLAVERLSFESLDNGLMFIFIGLVIAFVQGGYVRRKANIIGEDRMTLQGMVILIPGLLMIAATQSKLMLYGGLFFLSMGSAMIIPCLTSLVSFYAPSEAQGRAIGIFRSLGSLGRVIGPIIASLIYWKYGSTYPYLIGAISLVIPMLLVKKLPTIKEN